MQKQIPVFIIILLIVGGLSFYAGQIMGVQQTTQKYEQKVKTAFNIPDEIKNISGQIKSIGDNSLVIEGILPTYNPLAQNQSKEYTFSINDETKIISRKIKSSDELGKTPSDVSFSPFVDRSILINDLKIGATIEITAKDNLKNINKSIAEQIIYMNMSELAPVE